MLQQRQLPDGTWYNAQTNVAEAPLNTRGAPPKMRPSPAAGVSAPPLQAAAPDPLAQSMDGFVPGPMQLQARPGRNYPALGALDGLPDGAKRVVALAAVLGVAVLTVWLQNRKKSRK